MEIRKEITNRPDPAKQRALEAQERKNLKNCMTKMHIPKCVVDGTYKESKHNSEMNRKRQAYLQKFNRTRPVYDGISYPSRDVIMPDWEAMNDMFPNYEKTKCHQHWINEEQVRQLRNQQDFMMKGGQDGNDAGPYPMGIPYLPKKYQIYTEGNVSNASGTLSKGEQRKQQRGGLSGVYPYGLGDLYIPKRYKKCRGVNQRIKDDKVPNATKGECASLCVAQNRKRQRDWNKPPMTEKQHIAYLEKQRDVPGTPPQEFKSLDAQIWNQKQVLCEREKLYKLRCSNFEDKKEQNKLNSLIPLALGGLALYVLLD